LGLLWPLSICGLDPLHEGTGVLASRAAAASVDNIAVVLGEALLELDYTLTAGGARVSDVSHFLSLV